jgi:hypothetical protein
LWRRYTDPELVDDPARARRIAAGVARPAFAVLFILACLPFAIFIKQIGTPLDADTIELTEYLNESAPTDARVMLEDSGWNDRDKKPPKYGEGQYPALLADLTGREFIGGPYPYVFLSYHYADFHDGKFLGKKLSKYSDGAIREAMDRFNIGWIVCWSPDCKNYFLTDAYDFRYLKTMGKFVVFERAGFRPNPFLAGNGFVIADTRGIRCYRVKPEAGKAILKYHWFKMLGIPGGGKIRDAMDPKYPIGFIEVENPDEYFSIINGYGRRN